MPLLFWRLLFLCRSNFVSLSPDTTGPRFVNTPSSSCLYSQRHREAFWISKLCLPPSECHTILLGLQKLCVPLSLFPNSCSLSFYHVSPHFFSHLTLALEEGSTQHILIFVLNGQLIICNEIHRVMITPICPAIHPPQANNKAGSLANTIFRLAVKREIFSPSYTLNK